MRAGTLPMMLYVPAMLSEEFGLGLASVGAIFAAIRFTDMAWDPAIAIFLDKTHSRFGRRRPWMVAATPILLLAMVLLYMPGLVVGNRVTSLYLFGALAVHYIGTTLYGLSTPPGPRSSPPSITSAHGSRPSGSGSGPRAGWPSWPFPSTSRPSWTRRR